MSVKYEASLIMISVFHFSFFLIYLFSLLFFYLKKIIFQGLNPVKYVLNLHNTIQSYKKEKFVMWNKLNHGHFESTSNFRKVNKYEQKRIIVPDGRSIFVWT